MAEREAERKIHIRMTSDMHRRLRIRCVELDVTIQDNIVRTLDQDCGMACRVLQSGRSLHKEPLRQISEFTEPGNQYAGVLKCVVRALV